MNIKKLIMNNIRRILPFYYLPNKDVCSDIPLDVIIPTCSKDYRTLKMVVDSIRKYVKHPIGKIMIIAPKGDLENFCKDNNLVFIDENTVLPITKKDIKYTPCGKDRSGWIFQQLLKLNSDTLTDKDYFLIVDSDTVFTRPQTFIDNKCRIGIVAHSKAEAKWVNIEPDIDTESKFNLEQFKQTYFDKIEFISNFK